MSTPAKRVKERVSHTHAHDPNQNFFTFGIQQHPETKRYGVYIVEIKGEEVLSSELFEGQTEEELQFAGDALMKALYSKGFQSS